MIIFAISRPPGAPMKLAVIRYFSSMPIAAYPAITAPAIVAMPTVMIANSSDSVLCGQVRPDHQRRLGVADEDVGDRGHRLDAAGPQQPVQRLRRGP